MPTNRPDISLRDRLEYGLTRCVGAIFGVMPANLASLVMGKLWRWIAPMTSRQKRVMEHLGHAFPEMTATQKRVLAANMWENIGRTAAESFHIGDLIGKPERIYIEQPDIALAPHRDGEGAILVTLHCGNWELTGPLAAREGLPITVVYQSLRNPLVEVYLLNMRKPFIPGDLLPKGHKMAREFLKLVKQKAPVAMAADQRDARGINVTFFGRPATATPFPAMLARASDTPIIVGMIRRRPGYHVTFDFPLARVDVDKTDNRAADIARATQAVHDIFETWIRQTPDQYMWAHKKWQVVDDIRRRSLS